MNTIISIALFPYDLTREVIAGIRLGWAISHTPGVELAEVAA